jgi:hypothetical protein
MHITHHDGQSKRKTTTNIEGFCKDSRCVNGRVRHDALSSYVRSESVTSHGGGINRR